MNDRIFDEGFEEGVRQILIDEYRAKHHAEPNQEKILVRLKEVLSLLNMTESK